MASAKEAERLRAYYLANRETVLARVKAWAEANPERVAANKRRSYDRNPGIPALRAALWELEHPERTREGKRVRQAGRRSRLAGATCVPATRGEIDTLASTCMCGAPGAHLDHVVPVSRGGCANVHNLQWLCAPCNLRKHNTLPPVGSGCPAFWAGE